MDPTLQDETKPTDARWRFFRDVVVFELKMFIGNLRDFALMPVSLGAAIIDLVSKGRSGRFAFLPRFALGRE